jgi:hypothetical protein
MDYAEALVKYHPDGSEHWSRVQRCQQGIPRRGVLPHPCFHGEETSAIPIPAKCHEGDLLPIPVRGIIPVEFPVSALVHISLYDVNYSHIHEFILMVYKQIPSIKIHIWDWESEGLEF